LATVMEFGGYHVGTTSPTAWYYPVPLGTTMVQAWVVGGGGGGAGTGTSDSTAGGGGGAGGLVVKTWSV
jgi:hypothetical protein